MDRIFILKCCNSCFLRKCAMRKYSLLIVLALVGWSLSCEAPEDTSEPEISVRYTLSGGWVGGIHTILTISTEGVASLENVSPVPSLKLSPEEYEDLLTLFEDFGLLAETYLHVGCMDAYHYAIEYTTTSLSKTVEIDGCSLDKGQGDPDIDQLQAIINSLGALASTLRT